MIFVGGSLHGQNIEPDNPTNPPPIWHNLPTGEQWRLLSLDQTIVQDGTHTVLAKWRVFFYINTTLPQEQVGPNITDALTRWYFATHGERLDQANGTTTTHLAECHHCTPGNPVPFSDLLTRAQWMRQHVDAGHRVTFSDQTQPANPTPAEETTTDGNS